MNQKLIALFVSTGLLVLPITILADIIPQSISMQPTCINITQNLKMGSYSDSSTKIQILHLQLALVNEGFLIDTSELGTFGQSTKTAVKVFQEKYSQDILAPFGLTKGTGYVGTNTRLKLQALYGCRVNTFNYNGQVNLAINNLTLDNNGVTATFCNNGQSDIPEAPFRIRLNGINRDFEELAVQKAGVCVTDNWLYSTWGLSFDSGSTFTAVAIIDPYNFYKQSQIQLPSSVSTIITVPALAGAHLSVRSVLLKTTGLQATFCNLGTDNLTSFPVQITVNGTSKTFDVPEVYNAGKCIPKSWTYDNWGITYKSGTSYSATIIADPNNVYKETNEFDNVASVIGTP